MKLPAVVLRYTANDTEAGKPQRCVVIYDGAGKVVAVADEGSRGRERTVGALLDDLEVPYGFVIDIGDVDVRNGVYRRMLNYRITDGAA